MDVLKFFPECGFSRWIALWKRGYSERYGTDDDLKYKELMAGILAASNDETLHSALTKAFKWKDPIEVRWSRAVAEIDWSVWNNLKQSAGVPTVWPNGIVFNVFLLHLASNGTRPIIDQHAWRGYCFLTNRRHRPELATYSSSALAMYTEYESWFEVQVSQGCDSRDLDISLMAFGQFCGSYRKMIEFYLSNDKPAAASLKDR